MPLEVRILNQDIKLPDLAVLIPHYVLCRVFSHSLRFALMCVPYVPPLPLRLAVILLSHVQDVGWGDGAVELSNPRSTVGPFLSREVQERVTFEGSLMQLRRFFWIMYHLKTLNHIWGGGRLDAYSFIQAHKRQTHEHTNAVNMLFTQNCVMPGPCCQLDP